MKKSVFENGVEVNVRFKDGQDVKDIDKDAIVNDLEGPLNDLIGLLSENHVGVAFTLNPDPSNPSAVLVLTGNASRKFGDSLSDVAKMIEKLVSLG